MYNCIIKKKTEAIFLVIFEVISTDSETTSSTSSIGCFQDDTNGVRDLPTQIAASELVSNSIKNCQTQCAKKGFKYAGVQFGYRSNRFSVFCYFTLQY